MFGKFGKNKKKSAEKSDQPKEPVLKKGAKAQKNAHRKALKKAGSLKQFPLIRALKLSEVVPSAVLDELKDFAQKNGGKGSGAVRRVTDGYTVVVLTEDTLSASGLNPHGRDGTFGQLAASLRGDIIRSATLAADAAAGRMVLIPDHDTLVGLDEYDELRNGITYQWAIFPDSADDDDFDTTVELLDNGATLGELMRIDEENQTLSVKDHKIVVGTTTTAADESQSQETDKQPAAESSDQPDNPPAGVPDSLFAGTDTGEEKEIPDPLAGGGDTEPPASSSAPAASQAATPPADSPKAPDDDLFGGISGADSGAAGASDSTASGVTNGSADEANDEDIMGGEPAGETALGDVTDKDDSDFKAFVNGTGDDDAATTSTDDEPQERATRPAPAAPVAEPKTTPQEVAESAKKANVSAFYDDSLGLTVDASVFNQMFQRHAPLQFTLDSQDADNELTRIANNFRMDANARLANLREHNMQLLSSVYLERVNTALLDLQQQLDVNDPDTVLGKHKLAIDRQHEEQQAKAQDTKHDQHAAADKKFQADREAYGEQMKQQALREFDELHRDELTRAKEQIDSAVDSIVDKEYVTQMHALNDRRRDVAHSVFNKTMATILTDMQTLYKQMYDREDDAFQKLDLQLKQLIATHYRDEVLRTQAIADAKRHDAQVEQLEQEKADLQKEMAAKLAAAEAEMKRTKAQSQAEAEKQIQAIKDDYMSRLAEKQQDLEALKKERQDVEARVGQQYQGQVASLQSALDTSAQIAKVREEQQDRELKRTRHSTIALTIVSVLASLAIGGLGGYTMNQSRSVGAGSSSRGNTPIQIFTNGQNSSSKASSSKADSDSSKTSSSSNESSASTGSQASKESGAQPSNTP